MTLGDRVVVMKDGWVQQVGDPLELYNAPANRFVAGFIGSPGMTFAAMSFQRDDDALWAVNHGLSVRIPEPHAARLTDHARRAATTGTRPHELNIDTPHHDAAHSFDTQLRVGESPDTELLLEGSVGRQPLGAQPRPTVRS